MAFTRQPKVTAEEWEKQGIPTIGKAVKLDPDAKPSSALHVRLNAWELEELRRLALEHDTSQQKLIRKALRTWLAQQAKRGR